MINQIHEELNDAFETYYPRLGKVRGAAYHFFNAILLRALRWRRPLFGGKVLVNERIIEYPEIVRLLRPSGAVLDVGCVSSRLPVQLASLGYEVHGLDLRDYQFSHPNFHFHKGNIFDWKAPKRFDSVIFLSTLEHIGLGVYGEAAEQDTYADARAIERVREWLAPGGQLLVTLPYGKAGVTSKHRIYDEARLARVFPEAHFRRTRAHYYKRVGGNWMPASAGELHDVASPELPVNGVAVLDFERV